MNAQATKALEAGWQADISQILAAPLPWQRLAGQHLVVTGASGFVGGYVTRVLLALNDSGVLDRPLQVTALVRNKGRLQEALGEASNDPQLAILEWDLGRFELPPIDHVSGVIHAASPASPVHCEKDPVGTLSPNTLGTVALLELLRRCDDPLGFLYISSSEVYGAEGLANPLHEESFGTIDPLVPRNFYAEAKRAGEATCAAYGLQYSLPTYIARLFHTYGLGLRENDGRVFADFLFNALRREPIVMKSQGAAVRAFCHGVDAVTGLFTILLTGQTCQPYNVANPGQALSVRQLADLIAGLSGVAMQAPPLETKSGADNVPATAPRATVLPDISRLEGLGWHPTITAEDGFRRLITAMS